MAISDQETTSLPYYDMMYNSKFIIWFYGKRRGHKDWGIDTFKNCSDSYQILWPVWKNSYCWNKFLLQVLVPTSLNGSTMSKKISFKISFRLNTSLNLGHQFMSKRSWQNSKTGRILTSSMLLQHGISSWYSLVLSMGSGKIFVIYIILSTKIMQRSSWSVNTAFAQFKNILSSTLDRHAPVVQKTVNGKPSPWLTEEVKRHMNVRDQLNRKAQKHGRPVDWQNFRRKKNFVINEIKRSKKNYFKNQLKENYKKSDKLWDTIKRIFPVKKTVTSSTKSFKVNDKIISVISILP